jgi:hypothetical protein
VRILPAAQTARTGANHAQRRDGGQTFRLAAATPAPARDNGFGRIAADCAFAVDSAARYVAQQIGQILEEDEGAGPGAALAARAAYRRAMNANDPYPLNTAVSA